MVTHYPQIASGETLSSAGQTDDGLGARILTWIRQALCGLHGHDNLLHFEKDRMLLQCASCGHQSPGWEVNDAARPVTRPHAEAPRRLARPHLVRARRIA